MVGQGQATGARRNGQRKSDRSALVSSEHATLMMQMTSFRLTMKEKVYLGNIDTLVLVEQLLRLKSVNSFRGRLLLGDQGATNCWSHCLGQLWSYLSYLGWRG